MNNMAGADAGEIHEITLDVLDDSVVVSVKPVAGGSEDPDVTLLARTREKRQPSYGHGVRLDDASSQFKHFAQELRRIDRSKSMTAHALKGLRFISQAEGGAERRDIEMRFDQLAKDGLLHRSDFGECIGNGMKKLDFAGVLFDTLARRAHISGDSINKGELFEFLDHVSNTSFDSRLLTFFDMVDKDYDGRITEEEVKEIITLSASANKLSKVREKAKEYARLVMEELDPDGFGYIELHSLETLLLQEPSQSTHSRKLSRLLSQNLSATDPNPLRRWYRRASCFLEDNWRRVWVMLLWLSICIALFTWKFTQYRRRAVFQVMGYCVCVAKGGAETLKFNMALILLPVCRNTITWIRDRTAVGRAVPFDDNLNFHQVVAAGISVGAGLHVISHLACDFPRLLQTTPAEYAPMIPFFGEKKPPNYWWFVKGTEGWTGLVMLVLMAIVFLLATPWFRRSSIPLFPILPIPERAPVEHYQPVRRRNERNERLNQPIKWLNKRTGFNVFWYSHHLLVIVYALLIVHGHFLYLTHKWYKKSTWMYLAVPVLLYACERLTRALRSRVWAAEIVKAVVYPGDVLSLHFSKPPGFRCKSGQYIFVHCADVSPFQWHPFSITSAPQDNYVSVHIRALGDWTGELNKVFSEALERQKTDPSCSYPTVRIDGPYGAPSQDYKQYDVVLLVGLGIGATPMISIIKDIINDTNQLDGDLNASASVPFRRCRRAYFYWSTREEGSFEWFSRVMDEVAESDKKRVIELHNHCTSVYQEGDARSALITMLQSLNRAKGGVDVVSSTRVETHFGRINWRDVYKRIALNHRDQRVGVFYCGASLLTNELRELAQDFSRKSNTKFEFHKENF